MQSTFTAGGKFLWHISVTESKKLYILFGLCIYEFMSLYTHILVYEVIYVKYNRKIVRGNIEIARRDIALLINCCDTNISAVNTIVEVYFSRGVQHDTLLSGNSVRVSKNRCDRDNSRYNM